MTGLVCWMGLHEERPGTQLARLLGDWQGAQVAVRPRDRAGRAGPGYARLAAAVRALLLDAGCPPGRGSRPSGGWPPRWG